MGKRTVVLVLALLAPLPASAQLPNGSTSALGLGGSFTAAARGYGAVAWNPALLGASSNSGASMTLLTALSGTGLGPVGLSDIADYSDELVPEAVKQDWLSRARLAGSERGTVDADMTWGAAQIGRFGLQVSTSVRTLADLSPDVLQLVLLGNVDENGDPTTLDFAGSSLDLAAFSTLALGYAHPVQVAPGARLLVGVTGKYTIGHVLVMGEESQGTADAEGFRLAFPIVNSVIDPDSLELNNGRGIGVDLGVALELGAWTFGAAVQNVTNSFEWDAEKLRYRPLELSATEGEMVAETEEQPLDAAPEALRERAADLGFRTSFGLGAAYQPTQKLLVTADLRRGSDEGMVTGPTSHLGAGVEFRPLSWLPLRAGAAAIALGEDNRGFQFGGGLGINLGGWNLAASALQRDTDRFGGETLFMGTIFATGLP